MLSTFEPNPNFLSDFLKRTGQKEELKQHTIEVFRRHAPKKLPKQVCYKKMGRIRQVYEIDLKRYPNYKKKKDRKLRRTIIEVLPDIPQKLLWKSNLRQRRTLEPPKDIGRGKPIKYFECVLCGGKWDPLLESHNCPPKGEVVRLWTAEATAEKYLRIYFADEAELKERYNATLSEEIAAFAPFYKFAKRRCEYIISDRKVGERWQDDLYQQAMWAQSDPHTINLRKHLDNWLDEEYGQLKLRHGKSPDIHDEVSPALKAKQTKGENAIARLLGYDGYAWMKHLKQSGKWPRPKPHGTYRRHKIIEEDNLDWTIGINPKDFRVLRPENLISLSQSGFGEFQGTGSITWGEPAEIAQAKLDGICPPCDFYTPDLKHYDKSRDAHPCLVPTKQVPWEEGPQCGPWKQKKYTPILYPWTTSTLTMDRYKGRSSIHIVCRPFLVL